MAKQTVAAIDPDTQMRVDASDDDLLERLAAHDPLAAALVRRKDTARLEMENEHRRVLAQHERRQAELEQQLRDLRRGRRPARFFAWLFTLTAWCGAFALAAVAITQFLRGRLSDGKAVPLVLLAVAVMAVTMLIAQARSEE